MDFSTIYWFRIHNYYVTQSIIGPVDQLLICNATKNTGTLISQVFRCPCQGVEATGFEPTTSASRTQRSTKLSHASIFTDCSSAKSIIDDKTSFVNKIFHFLYKFLRAFFTFRHKKAPPVGLEPTTLRLTAACSTDWAMEDHSLSLFSLHVPSKLHTRNILLPTALRSTVPGQTLDRLVTVSSIHYCTSTSALSTSSSSRGLTSFEWDISSWGGLHA